MTAPAIPRLRLANLPTPLERPERLAGALGIDLWVKRDDASGGPEAGNKIRKLEFLLADALDRGCDTVVTCGGIQSNHARATAILAARLGLTARLMLRLPGLREDAGGDGVTLDAARVPAVGNVLLDRLVGAEVRLITADSYRHNEQVMARAAEALRAAGRRPYVIPEGGSNGLGALGYVEAMAEVRRQLDEGQAGGEPFDVVVHACGSGGTAAGVALGAARHGVARRALVVLACDDEPTFERRIGALVTACRALDPAQPEPVPWRVDGSARGPAYAVSTAAQRARIVEVARLSGLLLDPVYTGKAFSCLWDRCAEGALSGRRVLFLHTGGLPGLLAQAATFDDVV